MSVFGKDAEAFGKFAAGMPLPEFEQCSFSTPIRLYAAKVAIVTTAPPPQNDPRSYPVGRNYSNEVGVRALSEF